jgi:hypothetical protein
VATVLHQRVPVYRPRRPRASPLYQLIERYYPDFARTYDERFERRYGPWRPVIGVVCRRFLRCGDLHFGFARVRCTGCRHEMFVPFSCRQRCVCPTCHQKRSLLMAHTVAQSICQSVPHRQLVFTIPKRFRIYFRLDRSLLGGLARAAWETVRDVYRRTLGRDDVLPGMIAGIQTFGELVHFHPHIHALVTDGGFLPDGTFVRLPRIGRDLLLTAWQSKVFDLLLAADKIDQDTVDAMRSWPHSGFSVDDSVRLTAGDRFGLERLAQYILRCPFSLARVVRLTDEGSVIYRAEKDHCRQFPGAASADLRGGPRRNFQVFSALDFLAELTQHIPDKGEHLVRYYGWYSHRRRGMRAKSGPEPLQVADLDHASGSGPRAGSVSTWAMLIKRVYEVDPLECPHCGGTMKIIGFIERRQHEVIERILRHCGLWEGPIRTLASARAPPRGSARPAAAVGDLELVLDREFQESQLLESQRLAGRPRELQLVLDPEYL